MDLTYERNGIRAGERVVCVSVPRLLGTVLRCAPDGVSVRWDDGRLGELVWSTAVAYSAFQLQIVRTTRALTRLNQHLLPPPSLGACDACGTLGYRSITYRHADARWLCEECL